MALVETLPAPDANTRKLARSLKLKHVAAETLSIRRRRLGERFSYQTAKGITIKDRETLARLKSLAVPPAYEDVLYAEDPRAHIQAIGRDAAGRLQYRYHPDWQKVREMRKSARLARLAEALPRIRRAVGRYLGEAEPSRALALAAVVDLVARSAIRPGSESYAKLRGTRGAATLLKSNVSVQGDTITLKFRAKGGKNVVKSFAAPRLCEALAVLRQVPGRRLFQFRNEAGDVRMVTAREVNVFLREIAETRISLKDFRTLLASVSVLEALAKVTPATSKRARRSQVLEAIRAAAEDLSNTPAICAKSYVHETVVAAFEEGVLEEFADALRATRSPAKREQVLAEVIATAAAA
ncbi:eukaryotic DNA topoisomerase I, catalytic core [Variibacter gotjawalensis]|uniref:Eukaryotic DNA topoisomerase I, catalytic core n=1 Tax=Variibacter gotjawalensis TaxID=1333996 RepID=A0A0S3PNV7_9BRAD|nr:DNA topoisomerase IB [Variibacter gotjawalensis]NIK47903.1 DNA topoisomerase-1 [Variibacter gotjawalensis]RZS49781.1 DNA topoisomerase-1 [Variibacter gotjawalensis]BAT57610.1 eukaryotic DNA topoisomerase I, catalytic core [Variibacter gotjawalensis]